MSSVEKKTSNRKGVLKQRSTKIRKLCTEADKTALKIRPGLVNTASATTAQNQVSINVQSVSSTVVKPTHISSLPSTTFPTPGPGIMPSQESPLSSPFVSQQRFPVFPASMSSFTLVLLHGNISVSVGS